MDAAKWAPHLCPTRQCTSDAAAHTLVLCLSFFIFYFFMDLRWLSFNSCWFPLNRVDSARIRSYRLNQIVSVGSRNWPKRPKQAEIGLESCWNGFKKKKKLNPSNYFISWATFQTIWISSNLSLIDSILPFKNALENRVWETRVWKSSVSHSIFKYIFKWQNRVY